MRMALLADLTTERRQRRRRYMEILILTNNMLLNSAIVPQTNNAMDNTRATTHFWTEEQTEFMLNVLKELNILKFMDGRKTRNGELFKKVALKMVEAGFPRTPEQIRSRWKNVKKAFFRAKRDNGVSGRGRTTCPFYDVIDDLLGSRPLSLVENNGVDSGVPLPTTMGKLISVASH